MARSTAESFGHDPDEFLGDVDHDLFDWLKGFAGLFVLLGYYLGLRNL